MRIVIDDLPADGLLLAGDTRLDLADESPADEVDVPEPLSYRLRVWREGAAIEVEGQVAGTVRARCGRCAGRFPLAVDRSFVVTYRAVGAAGTRGAQQLDEDDLSLDYYEGDAIDGQRLLAEQVLLALPMKLLCAEECRGLCARCGADLNKTECDCGPHIDPRLSPLSALRDRH